VADTNTPPPILPAHLEETIGSITRLHAEHYQNTTLLQRSVDRMTALFGRPGFIDVLTVIVVGWMSLNRLAAASAIAQSIPLPSQGWEARFRGCRSAWWSWGEQKTAKVIELLEEFRPDNPLIRNRVDQEAGDMAQPADPQRVLDSPKIISISCL